MCIRDSFFTGFSRLSSEIQTSTERKMEDKIPQLLEILHLVDKAEEILTNNQIPLSEFGQLLDDTWQLKRKITDKISNDVIDNLYDKAIKAGALGGKLLGAGGGGFLLFYVESNKQAAVKKALENLLYVPFSFENQGARIIYYTTDITKEMVKQI